MSIQSDSKAIVKMLKEFDELDINTRPYFVECYDSEVIQLVNICLSHFPSFDISLWRKCLKSIKRMLFKRFRSLAEFEIDEVYAEGHRGFLADLVSELIDDLYLENEVNSKGLNKALERLTTVEIDELQSCLSNIGFSMSKSDDSYEFSLVDRKSYISYSVSKKAEQDLGELILSFLSDDSHPLKLMIERIAEADEASSGNKFRLGNTELSLVTILHYISRYRVESDIGCFIKAQSLAIEALLSADKTHSNLDIDQVLVDAKYSKQSADGGNAKASMYKRCLIKTEEFLKEEIHGIRDFTHAAEVIRPMLESWKRELKANGEDVSEILIYSKTRLSRKVIGEIMDRCGLAFPSKKS